jgi:DNA-binding transcriptional ArsR family regulator
LKPDQILQLDPLIHAPTRLAILSILVTVKSSVFTFIKESIGTTEGNLSTHLSKLESGGLITIEKTFKNKRPQTICSITPKGKKAFFYYVNQLDQIVKKQKG